MSMASQGWTPRSARKATKKGTAKDKSKQKAFAKAAAWGKRFVHLSADACAGNADYIAWCKAADSGTTRRSSK